MMPKRFVMLLLAYSSFVSFLTGCGAFDNKTEKEDSASGVLVVPKGATFRSPLLQYTVTSAYGQRNGRSHQGIDLGAPEGVEVRTIGGGTKLSSGAEGACGNVVRMSHVVGQHAFESRHCHLSAYAGANGRWYAEGTVIGRVGMTGRTTGPHLHFELRKGGVLQNPEWWIAF